MPGRSLGCTALDRHLAQLLRLLVDLTIVRVLIDPIAHTFEVREHEVSQRDDPVMNRWSAVGGVDTSPSKVKKIAKKVGNAESSVLAGAGHVVEGLTHVIASGVRTIGAGVDRTIDNAIRSL